MQNPTRREFGQHALGSLLAWSFLEAVCRYEAFGEEVKPQTLKWLQDVNQLGWDLKDQKLKQLEWQKQIEKLYAKVDLADFLRLVDFDKLTHNLEFVDNGARSLRFKFPKVEGVPDNLAFGQQIFALKKGRSVVPHGHNNMATAFLILKGDFHGRHFDRLADEPEHMLIKPTIDRKFTAGECSTVSDYKDNIHWFQSLTDQAFIFNIHVMNVRPGNEAPTGRIYLDPKGEKLKDGTIRAKLLDYDDANKLYG